MDKMTEEKNEKKEYKYKCTHCSAVLTIRLPYWIVNPPPELHLYCTDCNRKRIFKPSD